MLILPVIVMIQTLKQVFYSAVQVVYPEQCAICKSGLVRDERHVCAACAFDLPYITGNQVDVTKLGSRFKGRREIGQVYSLFKYEKGNAVQTILLTIKYKTRPRAAAHFGRVLAQSMPADHGCTIIVPIPLHPKKERKRGFNQSMAIAEGLSAVLQIPIYNKAVIRNSFNESQTKFSKYDRYENVRSIFSVIEPGQLEDQHILIVDDVLTTGATIESCAAELLREVKGCKLSIATRAARV